MSEVNVKVALPPSVTDEGLTVTSILGLST